MLKWTLGVSIFNKPNICINNEPDYDRRLSWQLNFNKINSNFGSKMQKIAAFRMNREYKRSLARNNQERLDTMRVFWWTQFYNTYKRRVKENPSYREKDLTPLEIDGNAPLVVSYICCYRLGHAPY